LAATGEVSLENLRESVLIADSAPDSPVVSSTVVTSLWQLNLSAIMVERWFCAVKLRSDAVAVTNAVSNSPA
jgi:hypothetical protein